MPDDDCSVHGQSVPPGDPRYDGFRIRELWAFTAVDTEDNQEGLAMIFPGVFPIATDRRRVEDLMPYAIAAAKRTGRPLRLVHFTIRDEQEIHG